MDVRLQLERVSEELSLSNEPQDWGIVNADPGRVKFFIDYLNEPNRHSEEIQYQLIELIIASYNVVLPNLRTTI